MAGYLTVQMENLVVVKVELIIRSIHVFMSFGTYNTSHFLLHQWPLMIPPWKSSKLAKGKYNMSNPPCNQLPRYRSIRIAIQT